MKTKSLRLEDANLLCLLFNQNLFDSIDTMVSEADQKREITNLAGQNC